VTPRYAVSVPIYGRWQDEATADGRRAYPEKAAAWASTRKTRPVYGRFSETVRTVSFDELLELLEYSAYGEFTEDHDARVMLESVREGLAL
jgi:hypothetical protein